jgi:hypothetical protein
MSKLVTAMMPLASTAARSYADAASASVRKRPRYLYLRPTTCVAMATYCACPAMN